MGHSEDEKEKRLSRKKTPSDGVFQIFSFRYVILGVKTWDWGGDRGRKGHIFISYKGSRSSSWRTNVPSTVNRPRACRKMHDICISTKGWPLRAPGNSEYFWINTWYKLDLHKHLLIHGHWRTLAWYVSVLTQSTADCPTWENTTEHFFAFSDSEVKLFLSCYV